jgi:hypothetical protein
MFFLTKPIVFVLGKWYDRNAKWLSLRTKQQGTKIFVPYEFMARNCFLPVYRENKEDKKCLLDKLRKILDF